MDEPLIQKKADEPLERKKMKASPISLFNRLTGKAETITRGQLRRIRKDVVRNRKSRLDLPYDFQSINRIFYWLKPIDLKIDTPVIQQKTTPVETAEAVKPSIKTITGKTMTIEIARAIREASKTMSVKDIATAFGKGETTIRDIIKGKTWKEEIA